MNDHNAVTVMTLYFDNANFEPLPKRQGLAVFRSVVVCYSQVSPRLPCAALTVGAILVLAVHQHNQCVLCDRNALALLSLRSHKSVTISQ